MLLDFVLQWVFWLFEFYDGVINFLTEFRNFRPVNRIREAMRRVDPAGILLQARTIDPCQYSEFQGVDIYIQTLTIIERAQ